METKIIDDALCEIRHLEIKRNLRRRRDGRSTVEITCPFCNSEITVSIWSFSGCGKNCECGAKLGWYACWKKL